MGVEILELIGIKRVRQKVVLCTLNTPQYTVFDEFVSEVQVFSWLFNQNLSLQRPVFFILLKYK